MTVWVKNTMVTTCENSERETFLEMNGWYKIGACRTLEEAEKLWYGYTLQIK